MPTVPTATRQVSPRTAPDPLQNTRGASLSAFGGLEAEAQTNLGTALGQVSDVAAQIALDTQMRDNDRAAKQLDTQFAGLIRNIGSGSEGSPGFYSLKGQAALDANGGALSSIEEAQADILDGITNEAVRRMFQDTSEIRKLREFNNIAKHTAGSRLVADKAASIARAAEALDYAKLHFADDASVISSVAVAHAEALIQAEAAGFGEEAAASAAQAGQTVIIAGAIEAAVKGGNTRRAQQLLDSFSGKGLIDGRVLPDLQEMVRSHVDIEAAQLNAEEALRLHPNDQVAALKFLRESLSGREEADAVAQIKTRFSEQSSVEAAATKRIEGDAAGAMHNGTSYREWSQANPREAQALQRNTEAYNRVRQAEQLRAKGQAFKPVSNNFTIHKISRMPTKELIELDPNIVRALLTEEEFGQFMSKQSAARQAAEKLESNPTVFNGAVTTLKGMFSDDINEDDERLLVQEMREFVATTIDTTGKPPKQVEVFAEAQRLLLNVRGDTKPGFTGLGRGGFNVLAAEADTLSAEQRAVARVNFEDIPRSIMQQIKDAFVVRNRNARNKGQQEIDVTDDLVESMAGAIALGDEARTEALLDEVE